MVLLVVAAAEYGDHAKQTVRFVTDAGSKVQRICGTVIGSSSSKFQSPQSIDRNWQVMMVLQRTIRTVAVDIEDVDESVAEVPDQQMMTELSKARRGQCNPPW